jgi:type VI secretion system secreted protein Hcp
MVIAVALVFLTLGYLSAIPQGTSDAKQSGGSNVSERPVDAAYVKFEGIDGEAQDKDHKGWSDLLSFNQAISNPIDDDRIHRRQRGALVEDIICVKELDKASPKIAEKAIKGQIIPKVELHFTDSYSNEDVVYYKYELTNVIITSYSVGSENLDEEYPEESFALNFEEIKVTYTETDNQGKKKGNVEYTWNVEEGES